MESNELMHYGVKGMKWGVRRSKNNVAKGRTKKRSRLERAADAAQRDADNLRKHGYTAEADAVQKVADKNRQKAAKQKITRERATKIAAKGAAVTSKILLTSAMDDIFYGGAGKEAIKQTGRAAITAIVMARGGYDIKWYDKQGRRVG